MPRPPKTLNDFIGQPRIIRHVKSLIDGAKALAKPCPSLLLTAPSGYGKTVLAAAIATEYGSTLQPLFAGEDVKAADICETLFQLQFGDIFFIDEAHSLRPDAQQILYTALDQHKAPARHDNGLRRTDLVSIAAFTLIVATNEPGRLKKPLRNRLERIELDRYGPAELKAIGQRVAQTEGIEITSQAARKLAEVAQGAPRHMYRRIETLRYFYPNLTRFTQEHVDRLLESEGIDAYGLWPQQRHYLQILAESGNGACSLERLEAKLGGDAAFIRQEIEPYLVDLGFIDFGKGGRVITNKGRAVAAELASQQRAADGEEAGQ